MGGGRREVLRQDATSAGEKRVACTLLCIYLAQAMANARCCSQEVAQSVSRFWQDVVIRLWAWRAWVKHREVPGVVQWIRVGHAETSLHKIEKLLKGTQH